METKEPSREFKWQFYGLLSALDDFHEVNLKAATKKQIAEYIAEKIIAFDKYEKDQSKIKDNLKLEEFSDYFSSRFEEK